MRVPEVPFLEAIQDVSAGNTKIPQSAFLDAGSLAVVDQGQSLIAGYTNAPDATVKTASPVIVFGDHTRALKFVNFPFAMGADGVKVLRVRDDFDPKFVYRFLESRPIPSAGYSRHFKFLKEVEIPKPPLDEQRRIAAILDQADDLRAKRRQVIAQLDTLTHSIFHNMFGTGEKGTTVTLVEVIKWSSGKFLPVKDHRGGSIPVFGGNGVNGYHDEYMYLERRLIVGRVGAYCGAVHVTPPKAWVTDNALVATIRMDGLTLDYLRPALTLANLNQFAGVSGQPSISAGKIGHIQIPLPTLAKQVEFAQQIDAVNAQRITVLTAQGADDELFATLQSRAFRGEL